MVSNLVDAKGNEIKTHKIPVVEYKEFVFPMESVKPEDLTPIGEKGVDPLRVIHELRASTKELRQKWTLLAAGLCILAKKNPELKEFVDAIGLVIKDLNEKVLYEPKS